MARERDDIPADAISLYKLDDPSVRQYTDRMETVLLNWMEKISNSKLLGEVVGKGQMKLNQRHPIRKIIFSCARTLLNIIVKNVCKGLVNPTVLQDIGAACLIAALILPFGHDADNSRRRQIEILLNSYKGDYYDLTYEDVSYIVEIVDDIVIRTKGELCSADMSIDKFHDYDGDLDDKGYYDEDDESISIDKRFELLKQKMKAAGVSIDQYDKWFGTRRRSRSRRSRSRRNRRSRSRSRNNRYSFW